MHEIGGYCFVDFAASAPYVEIDMHPAKKEERLDGVFFSPHKFLGGPGTSGVLVFESALYKNRVPDQPGGGTVDWTNPCGGIPGTLKMEARRFLSCSPISVWYLRSSKYGIESLELLKLFAILFIFFEIS